MESNGVGAAAGLLKAMFVREIKRQKKKDFDGANLTEFLETRGDNCFGTRLESEVEGGAGGGGRGGSGGYLLFSGDPLSPSFSVPGAMENKER